MSTLLKIDVSLRGEHSISHGLGSHFATERHSNYIGGEPSPATSPGTKSPYVDRRRLFRL